MNNDLSSYFEDPEFKDLLAKYEGMAESHTPTYFDAEIGRASCRERV